MLKIRKFLVVSAIISPFMLLGTALTSTSEVTYESHIKKIMAEKCLTCHGQDAPTLEEFKKNKDKYMNIMKGPRMVTYEELIEFVKGKDAGALMRRLDDGKNRKDGKPGNMYQYLGSTEEERAKNLEIFKRWVGYWTLKIRAELTEEELKLIKVPR